MIEIRNLTKRRIPATVFKKLFLQIFSKDADRFELSLVCAGPVRMRKLNRAYRGKDKVANVLSFLLEKNRGEIFLHANLNNLPFLFVHGCLHLLGYDHERERDAIRMEQKEANILKQLHARTQRSHRNRSWH